MSAIVSQITGVSIVCITVQAQIKENIRAARHTPLWGGGGGYTGDGLIPLTKGAEVNQYVEDGN